MGLKSSWPAQEAIIVSDSKNFCILVNQLLKMLHWKIVRECNTVQEAMLFIKQKEGQLLILDDKVDAPAIFMLRSILQDPFVRLCPIFCFLLENRQLESHILKQFGIFTVCKPLTPSTFLPVFSNMLKFWESKPNMALRLGLAHEFIHDQDILLQTLEKLEFLKELEPIVVPSIAICLEERQAIKDAEALLLRSSKTQTLKLEE